MAEVLLKGREVPLLYTVCEMRDIQKEIGPISQAIPAILGRNPDDDKDMSRFGGADHIEAVAKMIRILGNAGLEEAGESTYLTDKFVMRALKPSDMVTMINAGMEAMNEGMASEIPPKDSDEPVDVTLEEMNKKKEKEN